MYAISLEGVQCVKNCYINKLIQLFNAEQFALIKDYFLCMLATEISAVRPPRDSGN